MSMNMRQINYNSSPVSYLSEGMPYTLVISKENITGNPTSISTLTTAKQQVPIDFVCDQISAVFFMDNPDNPGVGDCIPTSDVKIMIRDNLTQENWIFTNGSELAQGNPVPLNLLFGPYPLMLPAPRPMYENSLIEVDIEPGSQPIVDFQVIFHGRRIDMMPPWEVEQICGDPRTSGAYWVYFDPVELTREDTPADPCKSGPVSTTNIHIPTIPFDIMVTGISGFVTATPDSASPINRAWFEYILTDRNNSKQLADSFVPSYYLGGHIFNSSAVPPLAAAPLDLNSVLEYMPRVMPLHVAWHIRQQSAIELRSRAKYSPLDIDDFPTLTTQIMLHGMRVPSSEIAAGFPYYNRNTADLRCPPGSNGIPPGYPTGPCPPYPSNGGYQGQQQIPYQGQQQAAQGQQQGQPQQGQQQGQPQQGQPQQGQPQQGQPQQGQQLGNFTPQPYQPGLPNQQFRHPTTVFMMNNGMPASEPYPGVAVNQNKPVAIRNPNAEGSQVMLPNKGPGAQGYGFPGFPADGRGPRFRNS